MHLPRHMVQAGGHHLPLLRCGQRCCASNTGLRLSHFAELLITDFGSVQPQRLFCTAAQRTPGPPCCLQLPSIWGVITLQTAMADWQVHQRHPGAQQPGGGVEWYASSSGAAQYGAGSYGYEMPASGGGGGAAYGSFEDEAPLLEGLRACWLVEHDLAVLLLLLYS